MKVAITIRLAVPLDADLETMNPPLATRLQGCQKALGAHHFRVTHAPDGSVEAGGCLKPADFGTEVQFDG